MSETLPRGVRNKNPGNLDRFPPQPFRGLAAEQTDPEFYVFADTDGEAAEVWGIRAMAIVLLAYQHKHGLNTLRLICGRYADRPGVDNPLAYAQAVARGMRVGIDDRIDLDNSVILGRVINGMIRVECAEYVYPPDTVAHAIALAYEADEIIDASLIPARPAPDADAAAAVEETTDTETSQNNVPPGTDAQQDGQAAA